MKLSSLLSQDSILQLDTVVDKWDLIRQMVARLEQTSFVGELDAVLKSSFIEEINRREELGSTGIGDSVAFPHARIENLDRVLVAFATIRQGVDFEALDGAPAHMAFLCLLPGKRGDIGVKILAVCSQFLSQPDIRGALLNAAGPKEIMRIMEQSQVDVDTPLIALDMMRPARLRLTRDMPAFEATQLMHRSRAIAAAVVDADDHVIGEVNCNLLLQRELPDYMTQLHSVPHISDFRPFEKYFTENARLCVGELMNTDVATVNEDASLLEIVFLLSIKKHPLLYVCRNEQLIGVIDPITVLDRVLNL